MPSGQLCFQSRATHALHTRYFAMLSPSRHPPLISSGRGRKCQLKSAPPLFWLGIDLILGLGFGSPKTLGGIGTLKKKTVLNRNHSSSVSPYISKFSLHG
jgi:hypothetical protein